MGLYCLAVSRKSFIGNYYLSLNAPNNRNKWLHLMTMTLRVSTVDLMLRFVCKVDCISEGVDVGKLLGNVVVLLLLLNIAHLPRLRRITQTYRYFLWGRLDLEVCVVITVLWVNWILARENATFLIFNMKLL